MSPQPIEIAAESEKIEKAVRDLADLHRAWHQALQEFTRVQHAYEKACRDFASFEELLQEVVKLASTEPGLSSEKKPSLLNSLAELERDRSKKSDLSDSLDIRPIRTREDYEWALREIEGLMSAELGSPEGDRLDILATLVAAYEEKRYPIGPADPIAVIEFHMERLGWSQAELARNANINSTHLSAVLNGKRALSLRQIKGLSAALDIPADRLIA
jgi:HTH-type transcriptional regulator/antitoxin HigA